jgi:hypothetical protein
VTINILYRTLCFHTALLLSLLLHGQLQANDVLANKIEVAFYQAPIADALLEVAHKGGFEWSYNANILDTGRRITLFAKDQAVREILHQILGGEYAFKQSGEYLILKKVKKPQQKVSGYLTDKNTGQKVPNATIYDRQTLKSTTTDENGYYELPVTPRSELVVSKLAYRDTVLQVTSQSPRFIKLEIKLDSLPPEKEDAWTSIQNDLARAPRDLGKFFNVSAQKFNELNVHDDTLHRHFQLSFLPNIGTNFKMSSSVTNDLSINILAGYSNGNRYAEFGGLGNITRGDITGVQAAGIFNEVSGNVTGVQASGFYNRAGGNFEGVQAAGFMNVAHQAKGVGVQAAGFFNVVPQGEFTAQAAGFFNHADSITVVQAAGFYNYARHSCGVQAAGFINISNHADAKVQAAGFSNINRTGKINVQAAGFSNVGDTINGAQVAGFMNVADTVNGAQVSGFINRANHLKGVQIGIINTAKEIDGVQIGLLNLSRRGGYIAIEASANEIHWTNVALKTGTRYFYTIFTAGISPSSGTETEDRWSYGVGVGTFVGYQRRISGTFDLIHRHISAGEFDDVVQEWEQFAPALNVRLGRKVSFAAGPTANLLIARSKVFQDNIVPAGFPEFSFGSDDRLRWWMGANVALRVQL